MSYQERTPKSKNESYKKITEKKQKGEIIPWDKKCLLVAWSIFDNKMCEKPTITLGLEKVSPTITIHHTLVTTWTLRKVITFPFLVP